MAESGDYFSVPKSVNQIFRGAEELAGPEGRGVFKYQLLQDASVRVGGPAELAKLLRLKQQSLNYWDEQWRDGKREPHPWKWILEWIVLTGSPFPTEDEAERQALMRVGRAASEAMSSPKTRHARGQPRAKLD